MHRFWKKVNRGLLLGGILLLGLAVFIAVKEAQFKKEIPAIRENVEGCMQELLEINLTPEGVEPGDYLTEEQRAECRAALEAWFDRYWDPSSIDEQVEFCDADELRSRYLAVLEEMVLDCYYDVQFSITDQDIDVVPSGPDYATVSLFSDTVKATYRGFTADSLFLSQRNVYVEIEEGEVCDPTVFEGVYNVHAQIEFKRVNGEWKIVGFVGNAWHRNSHTKEGVSA
ncbi:MAG: hypothetical protein IJX28_03165 [Clostridia bacterium]|nr:hypothetical protein [Clostridia bacterium]